MTDEANHRPPRLTRRHVLGVAAAGGLAGALVGCGAERAETGAGDEAPATGASETTPDDSAASPELAKVDDVPVGSGVILTEPKMVLTQPSAGEFKGFSSICTHQGCPVSSIKGKTISCECHGSAYSVVDGSAIKGPATRALREIPVRVEGDAVVVA